MSSATSSFKNLYEFFKQPIKYDKCMICILLLIYYIYKHTCILKINFENLESVVIR